MKGNKFHQISKWVKDHLETLERKHPFTPWHTSMIILLGVSFVLRIYNLSGESLWLDEIYSLERAKLSLTQIYEVSYRPLYFFFLHFWLRIFGTSELALRIPGVIFGVLSVFVLYKIGKLLFDERIGLLSALILALSQFHVWQSQEVRMYSMLAFFSALSMFYFLIMVKKEWSRLRAAGYLISSVLLFYTHPFGIFIIVAQNTFLFTFVMSKESKIKPSIKKWVMLQTVLFASFIPLLAGYLGKARSIQSGEGLGWISEPTVITIIRVFIRYSGHVLLFILFVLAFVLCIYRWSRERMDVNGSRYTSEEETRSSWWGGSRGWVGSLNKNKEGYLLTLWIAIPNIIPFFLSLVWKPIYGPAKYTITASLGFYLLAAFCILKLDKKKIKGVFVISIIILSALSMGIYYTTPVKEQWEDTANYIDDNAREGDLVIFSAGFTELCFNYYSERDDLEKRSFPYETRPRRPRTLSKNIEINQTHIEELESITEGYDRVWVVMSHARGDSGSISVKMDEGYNNTLHEEYVKIDVYLWEK
ncbi:MAG: glycosyltransferase family 39 protein [Thermoplasmata archaeon]